MDFVVARLIQEMYPMHDSEMLMQKLKGGGELRYIYRGYSYSVKFSTCFLLRGICSGKF